jgi:DNA modification methylase
MKVMNQAQGEGWMLYNGDSCEALEGLPPDSVDLSIFSPPFISVYTYSATERDLGNCVKEEHFWEQFTFISTQLLRVTKPGRNVCVHVSQVALQKAKDGVIGLKDFRGHMIQHFLDQGFIYHGEVCIDKDPQFQAIRTKAKALLFVQLHKDSAWSRPAMADYILVFRKPGENKVAIRPDISNDEWIQWARPIWTGIRETDTLQFAEARSEDDTLHLCPLQLPVIDRCIRLWSNPGEVVLSPFAGIGSEGYQAVKRERRFIGVELKPEYFKVAAKNLRRAESMGQEAKLAI